MNILKKNLCFMMAFAMIMSCLAMNAGAAFADQSDIQHPEAVAVLSELGILQGYENGEFGAANTLTRAEGATVIARMLLSSEEADALSVYSAPFADVSASHWAAGYISYCVSEGIVSGVGGNSFDPEGTLTVAQLAKMLLGALGYDAAVEGYTGNGWEYNVVADALKADLFAELDGSYTAACTRDNTAQMLLNTLKADMVYYASGSVKVEAGDTTVTVGGSAAQKEVNNSSTETIYDDNCLQFAEHRFTELVLDATTTNNAFGRPAAYTWELDDEVIYTGADETDLLGSYTASVSKGTLYSLIGKSAYTDLNGGDAALEVYVDGDMVTEPSVSDYFTKNSSSSAANTGRGVVTEVYMDDENNVTIVIINTYLAMATNDYDEDEESLDIEVYGWDGSSIDEIYEEDGHALDSFVEDDYMLITIDDGEVYSVEAAETVTGEVDGYTTDSSVKVDGTSYKYSKKYDTTEFGAKSGFSIGGEIVLVLDTYGHIIGIADAETSSAYVYIAEVAHSGVLSSSGYVAAAYFPEEGTYEEIAVKSIDGDTTPEETSVGKWYTYTVNSADKYILTDADDSTHTVKTFNSTKVSTENGKLYFINADGNRATSYKLTSATQFIVIDEDDNIDVYTGYANVPTINANQTKTVKIDAVAYNGYATYVFIDAGSATVKGGTTSTDDYMLVYYSYYYTSVDADENTYYNNQYVLQNAEDATPDTTFAPAVGLYTDLVYDEYGYIEDAELITESTDEVEVLNYMGAAAITYSNDVLTIGTVGNYALAEDYDIFVIDGSDYDTYSAAKLAKQDYAELAGTVYVVLNDNDEAAAVYFMCADIFAE